MWALECQYELAAAAGRGINPAEAVLCGAATRSGKDDCRQSATARATVGAWRQPEEQSAGGYYPPILLACVQCRPESSASANGTGASCVRVAEEKAAQSCTPGTVHACWVRISNGGPCARTLCGAQAGGPARVRRPSPLLRTLTRRLLGERRDAGRCAGLEVCWLATRASGRGGTGKESETNGTRKHI